MTKLITPEFRGSFTALDEPRGIAGDPTSEKKFKITIALPHEDGFWDIARNAVRECALEKFGKIPAKLKSPITSGDETDYDNLHGHTICGVSNSRKPGIVDQALQPIMDPAELYAGAWYRVSIRPYAWSHPVGGKGVSFSLDNVMKIRDDEAFDGSASAENDFAEYAGSVEDDPLLA